MRTRYVAAAAAVTGLLTATPAGGHAVGALHRHQPAAAGGGQAVVTEARRYLGVPYVWGGDCNGPKHCNGLDCSGLTVAVFRDLGVTLPRTSAAQVHAGVAVRGLPVARPGDLLFWANRDGVVHHVAIYAGNGRLIEAPETGRVVYEGPVYPGVVAIRRITVHKGET